MWLEVRLSTQQPSLRVNYHYFIPAHGLLKHQRPLCETLFPTKKRQRDGVLIVSFDGQSASSGRLDIVHSYAENDRQSRDAPVSVCGHDTRLELYTNI